MEQHTLPKQQTTVERDALFPPEEKPELTTSDVIIIGEDALAQADQSETTERPEATREVPSADRLFESFYDNYVAFSNDPSPIYVYHLPKKFPRDTEVYVEHNRAEVAEQKRQQLIEYARVAFINGDIHLDGSTIALRGPITVDSIAEAIVTDGIIRAQIRYDEALPESPVTYPAHVTVEHARPSHDEESTGFFDMFKSFGARAMKTLTLHSGEVTLPVTRTLPTVPIEQVSSASK